jgi:hypothetical protein
MPVEIRNLTLRPVLMRLNSGASLHLSPGMTSEAIAEGEISRNEKVQKLQDKRVIALIEVKGRVPKGRVTKATPPKGEGKSSTPKKKSSTRKK